MLRVQEISSFIEMDDMDEKSKAPIHKIDLSIVAVECQIFNAFNNITPILASRLSNLYVKLNDVWMNPRSNNQSDNESE